jgi:hypothetical protein
MQASDELEEWRRMQEEQAGATTLPSFSLGKYLQYICPSGGLRPGPLMSLQLEVPLIYLPPPPSSDLTNSEKLIN